MNIQYCRRHTYGRFEISAISPYNIIKPSWLVRFVGIYGLWKNLFFLAIWYFKFATRLQIVWGCYVATNTILLKRNFKKFIAKERTFIAYDALGVTNIEKRIISWHSFPYCWKAQVLSPIWIHSSSQKECTSSNLDSLVIFVFSRFLPHTIDYHKTYPEYLGLWISTNTHTSKVLWVVRIQYGANRHAIDQWLVSSILIIST